MNEPTTPIGVYKAMIDQLVSETRLLGSSGHVVERAIFSKAPAHQGFNKFIRSLSPEHRRLLSLMLQEERDNAIHDVLAALTWWINTRGVGLTFHGKPISVELSGAGLHGDYVGRLDGWDWPDTEDTEGQGDR
jgi:hypothetical protein